MSERRRPQAEAQPGEPVSPDDRRTGTAAFAWDEGLLSARHPDGAETDPSSLADPTSPTSPAPHALELPDQSPERQLIESAQAGDRSALEALYRMYHDTIYRYILFRLNSTVAAEDVTSQVFLGMVRGLPRFKWRGRPLLAWLYSIAQKQVAYYRRQTARGPETLESAAADLMADTAGPSATAEERERQRSIARALRMLPESQREVVLLRYVLSLSVAETAAAVGRTEGAVKQLQLRGLSTLRGILADARDELL